MVVDTPCIRCGKMRIRSKSWTEPADMGAPITYTLMICPDPECQKIVERELEKKRERMLSIQNKSLERRKNLQLQRTKKH